MITIADSIPESRFCLRIAEDFDNVFCTVGVHPHHAKDWKPSDADVLRSLVTSSPKVRAIGEIGLDYHYNFSPRDTQRPAFRAQLALAEELSLPVVVHCREAQNHSLRSGSGQAIADVRADLKGMDFSKVVLHCCSETWEDVGDLVAQGLRLSFTGIATYPQSEEIRRTIRECPIEQIMVETDSPYLAPVPYRGKRNEPAFVQEVAKLVAQIKQLSLEEVDRITTQNAVEFFQLPS